MAKTSIQWCDYSLNPIRARSKETGRVGHFCVKISPGCKQCYASRIQKPHLTQLEFIAENRDKVDVFFEEKALHEVLRRKKPTKFFWCDMTDMFGDWVPDEWIDRCFAVMALTPQHTHQILTKRAQRMYDYFKNPARVREGIFAALHDARVFPGDPRRAVLGFPSRAGVAEGISKGWRSPLEKHIWMGVSVEDRQRYEERVPLLRKVPADVRFLSIEPLLEDLGIIDLSGISWTIIGGESGPGARRFEIEWMCSIVEQCRLARVAAFCKQIGSNPYWAGYPLGRAERGDRKGGDMDTWPESVRVREFPAVRS